VTQKQPETSTKISEMQCRICLRSNIRSFVIQISILQFTLPGFVKALSARLNFIFTKLQFATYNKSSNPSVFVWMNQYNLMRVFTEVRFRRFLCSFWDV